MRENTKTVSIDFEEPENKKALDEIYLFLLAHQKATLKRIASGVPQLPPDVVKVFVLELWRRGRISPLPANVSRFGREARRWVTGSSGIKFNPDSNNRHF